MSKRIDYSRINVEDFLNELGLRNVERRGPEVFYSCPFEGHAHGDSTPSASMKIGDTRAHCFGCGWSGNALTFLAEYENCSPIKASRYIREWLGDDFVEPETTLLEEFEERFVKKAIDDMVEISIPTEELNRRSVDWQKMWRLNEKSPLIYMFNRGFTWDTLQMWDIGYDHISDRITIPYFDEDGTLVGFKGRAHDPEVIPRYKVLGGPEYGFDSFEVGLMLFGLDKTKSEVRKHMFVFEGELNTISAYQKGIYNSVGISGKTLSESQVQLIRKYTESVTFIFDELIDSFRAAEKLARFMPSMIVREHDKDAAEMTQQELKELIDTQTSYLLYL